MHSATNTGSSVSARKTIKSRNIGTVRDAAKRWCISDKTIRRMIESGELTGYYPTPRALRVDLEELDSLMEARSTKGAA